MGRKIPSDQMQWPISELDAVTPSDTVDLPGGNSRLILATVAGNIEAIFEGGDTTVFPIGAGQALPFIVSRIKDGSTTATGIFVGR